MGPVDLGVVAQAHNSPCIEDTQVKHPVIKIVYKIVVFLQ
jgi:hypothetical protein